MAWFKKTRKPIESPDKASRVPEGLWVKCPACNRALYHKDLDGNLQVCPHCAHHFRMSAAERLRMLFDDGQWVEHDASLSPSASRDKIRQEIQKRYTLPADEASGVIED